jgi:phenylalanyl-tRNA synthetase beta chain
VADESRLRTSLLPGLVAAVAYNAARRQPDVQLFEVGKVFRRPPAGAPLPIEREHVAVALAGCDATEARAVWDVLAEGLLLDDAAVRAGTAPGLHPTRTAEVVAGGEVVGVLGEVDPDVLAASGVDQRVAWIEVDLESLLAAPHGMRTHRPISRFPSSDVDLAFEVDEATPAGDVRRTLAGADDLVVGVRLFDVYRGEQVAGGRRSLAFTIRLQALDRTLTDDEVAEVRRRLIDAVTAAHPATLRG